MVNVPVSHFVTALLGRHSLLTHVSPCRPDAGALIPSYGALLGALGDVVEVGGIFDGVGQLAVHPRQFVQAGLLPVGGRVHNAGKRGRRPACASHREPAALQINSGTAVIGGHIGISAMRADDVCNAALVAGNGFIRADVSPAAAVNFADEVAV